MAVAAGIQWSLLSFRDDIAAVLDAFSPAAPVSAELRVPSPSADGLVRPVLHVVHEGGGYGTVALAGIPEEPAGRLRAAPSLVVVEEDASSPGGMRHEYVAAVVHSRAAPE